MQTPLSPLGSPVPSPVCPGAAITTSQSSLLSPSAAGASEMTPVPGDFPSVQSRVSDDAADSSQWKKDPTWMALVALTLMQTGNVEQARIMFNEMCIISRVWPPPAGMPLYFGALAAAGITTSEMRKTAQFYVDHYAEYQYMGSDDPTARLVVGRRPDLRPPRAWFRRTNEHDVVYIEDVLVDWLRHDRPEDDHPRTDMLPHVAAALEVSRLVSDFDPDEVWSDTLARALQHIDPPAEWTAEDVQAFQYQWLKPARPPMGAGKRPVDRQQSGPSTRVERDNRLSPAGRATAQDAGPSSAVPAEEEDEVLAALALAREPFRPQGLTAVRVPVQDNAAPRIASEFAAGTIGNNLLTIPYPTTMLRNLSGMSHEDSAYYRARAHDGMRAVIRQNELEKRFSEWYRAAPHGEQRAMRDAPTWWYHGTTAQAALSLRRGITLYSPRLGEFQDFNGSVDEDNPVFEFGGLRGRYTHKAFYLGDDFGQAASRAVSQLAQSVTMRGRTTAGCWGTARPRPARGPSLRAACVGRGCDITQARRCRGRPGGDHGSTRLCLAAVRAPFAAAKEDAARRQGGPGEDLPKPVTGRGPPGLHRSGRFPDPGEDSTHATH